ncbi:hypothetical protein ACFY71_04480 [Streptomyces cinerochromogenes]|uniref:hypothetical protein n=1 Tax=Streptomyces cinerochromogenes TaxID=66422 RepID=UPI003677E51C
MTRAAHPTDTVDPTDPKPTHPTDPTDPTAAPARAPHPLRAEALRGFAPWAGAAVLLSFGAMLAGTADRWQGGWAETATETHTAMLITLPLAAAAGCWQGGRERRRRTEELWRTTVRPPLARLLAAALPVALWVAAGYLVTAALALLATWPYAQGDHPHPALLPGDTVAMAAGALAGHVLGRTVPTRLAAPLLAMAGYVGLGVLSADGPDVGRPLSPATSLAVGELPVWWQPWAMAVWTGGLACAAALAYAARSRVTALLPLAAALAAGALLVQAGDGLWHTDPLARRQVCDTSTTPAVCVNARYAGMLPQVGDALSGVTGKLAGVRNLPARWADHDGALRADEARLPAITPLGWSAVRGRLTDPEQFAWEAVAALEGDDCPERTLTARVLGADDAVEHYLAPTRVRKALDEDDARGDRTRRAELRERRALRARLAGMAEDERRDWLSAYFAARAACDPKGVPAL